MSQNPEISILMPVFNEEKHLEKCLNSILDQDFKDWELISINDFSTDRSADILNNFASSDHRISVLENKSKGIIPALKLAFLNSKGKFITRMDADDIMPKIKLSVLRESIIKHGSGNIITGKVSYFSDKEMQAGFLNYEAWLNNLIETSDFINQIYKECIIPSACWMAFRSDLIKVNAFIESRYPEDYDLVFKFYKAGFKFQGVNEVLHLWRDHELRASRIDPNYQDQHFFDLKLDYFIDIDFDENKILFLWGAGKKGKKIATLLNEKNVTFRWVSNNDRKIGREVYDKIIEHPAAMTNVVNKQTIISIADKKFTAGKKHLYDEYKMEAASIYEF